VFISHNVHHAYAIGDRFTVLNHGRSEGTFEKEEMTIQELEKLMAGGAELEKLSAELQSNGSAKDEGAGSEESASGARG
jgi:simple sugar transport system ATP-binding protein